MHRLHFISVAVASLLFLFATPVLAFDFHFQATGGVGAGLTSVADQSDTSFGGGMRISAGGDFDRLGVGAYYSFTSSTVNPLEDDEQALNRTMRELGFGLYGSYDTGPVHVEAYAGYGSGALAYTVPEQGLGSLTVSIELEGVQVGTIVGYEIDFADWLTMQVGPWVQWGFLGTDPDIRPGLVDVAPDESVRHTMFMLAIQLSAGE